MNFISKIPAFLLLFAPRDYEMDHPVLFHNVATDIVFAKILQGRPDNPSPCDCLCCAGFRLQRAIATFLY